MDRTTAEETGSRSADDRIAEPLLGGPGGSHVAAAGARFRTMQAIVFCAVLGVVLFLAVALQGPCLSSDYREPHASARMCSSPLAAAFLGQANPEATWRTAGGYQGLSVLEARFVDLMHVFSGEVSVAMTALLLLNVIAFAALAVALLLLARQRAWLFGLFCSPVLLFTIGQGLDPVGLALAVWAVVFFGGPAPLRARPWLAGILLGLAAFINPLALLILLALVISGPYPVGRTAARSPLSLVSAAAITSALVLIADGTAITRLEHWSTHALDGGSFASILILARLGEADIWALVWIIAALCVVIAVTAAMFGLRRRGLDPVVAAGLFLGGFLLLSPGLMPDQSLWLLPFLVLGIRRWWVLIVWSLAEAAFAIAAHLSDVSSLSPEKGLDPTFLALFTLLRLMVLVTVVILLGENIHRRSTVTEAVGRHPRIARAEHAETAANPGSVWRNTED